MFTLAGKACVVTGASRGIGRAIALAFARQGADLVLAARSRDDLQEVRGLVEAEGRVLSRDRLLDVLGGPHSDGVLERSVDVYVGRLRSKLGDDPERPRYVATVRGTGYRAARMS